MSHFPMFRLVTLLARQLSTPIANYIKVYTRRHPRYSRSLCMGVGRAFHDAELRFRMWTLGLKRPRQLPPMSDQTALDSGAYILGEVVLFSIGGLILVLEVNRQANNKDDKNVWQELEEEQQWLSLLVSLEELQRELVLQQQDLDRLQNALRALTAPPSPTPAPVDGTSPHIPATPPPKSPTPPLTEECLPPANPPPPLEDECLESLDTPTPLTGEDLSPPDDQCPPSADESLPPIDEWSPPADLEPAEECLQPTDICPPPPEEPC